MHTSPAVEHDTGSTSRVVEDIPHQMLALYKTEAAPRASLEMASVPAYGPDDVLVRVLAASICGTDLHIYSWDPWAQGRVRPPYVFGHEFAGIIVAIGENVPLRMLGQYIAAESHIPCGRCYQCTHDMRHICRNVQIIGVDRAGAFAEYVSIPWTNAWGTSERIPPEIATIQEPMGNAVHTALSAPIAGSTVAVFGAGPIGLFAVPISRASGAARIITVEPSAFRRQLASDMGSDVVIDPAGTDPVDIIRGETDGEGVDVLLEMSGNQQAIAQGLSALRFGGFASLLGIPSRPAIVDLADGVIFKGATVQGISGRRIWQTWYQTRGFLESGMDVSAAITHRLPLTAFAEAFDLVASARSGKVVLLPPNHSSGS